MENIIRPGQSLFGLSAALPGAILLYEALWRVVSARRRPFLQKTAQEDFENEKSQS
jgi:hypothetical protein